MELTEKKLGIALLGSVLAIIIGILLIRNFPVLGLPLLFGGMLGIIIIPNLIVHMNEQDSRIISYGLTPSQTSYLLPKIKSYSIIEAAYRNEKEAFGVRKISVEVTEE